MSSEEARALLAAAREDLERGWSVRGITRLQQAVRAGSSEALEALLEARLAGRAPGGLRAARTELENLEAPTPRLARLRATLRLAGTGGETDLGKAVEDMARAAAGGLAEAAIELALLDLEAGDAGRIRARQRLEAAAESPLARRLLALLDAESAPPDTMRRSNGKGETLNERPRIQRFRGAFTPLECRWLQETARARLGPSLVADPATGAPRANSVRTSEAMHFGPEVAGAFAHRLAARMARLAGHAPACGEPLTVLRYLPGQEYKPHYDGLGAAALAHDPLAPAGERLATVLAWLNAPEAGGATLFPRLGLRVEPAPGDAIVFENLDETGVPASASLHAGEPVAAGEKWLASLWIRERAVRLP